ncbi:hypothetical protein J1614_002200 [Plenodomus biglobosus]|nr:hypothetical protein J1614_002200 [Plenodomus biglobosus]
MLKVDEALARQILQPIRLVVCCYVIGVCARLVAVGNDTDGGQARTGTSVSPTMGQVVESSGVAAESGEGV